MKGIVLEMKKLTKTICLALVFCLAVLALCSCGGEDVEIDMQAVLNANASKSFLGFYDSAKVTYENEDGEEYGYYVDSELGYYWEADLSEVTCGDVQYGLSGNTYYRCFYAGMETDFSWYEYLTITPEIFLAEEVVKCKLKNGVIMLTTKINVEKMADIGYEYSDEQAGGYFLTEYSLDAQTLIIKEIKERFVYSDGVKTFPNKTVVEYNTSRPEQADTLLARAKTTADTRTVTVVLDPNTAEEISYTMTTPKGDAVLFYTPEEYMTAYTDRECTTEYDGADNWNEDLTLYVTK